MWSQLRDDHLQEVPNNLWWLTLKTLVFCSTGPWGEVVVYDRWSQLEVWMNVPSHFFLAQYSESRGFIKGRALGKLTGCEQDFAINLPGCFRLLSLLSFIRKTKNARLKTHWPPAHKLSETPVNKQAVVVIEIDQTQHEFISQRVLSVQPETLELSN